MDPINVFPYVRILSDMVYLLSGSMDKDFMRISEQYFRTITIMPVFNTFHTELFLLMMAG